MVGLLEDLYMKYREPINLSKNNNIVNLGLYNPAINYIKLNDFVSQYFKFFYAPLTVNHLGRVKNLSFIEYSKEKVFKVENSNHKLLLSTYGTFLHEVFHSWQFYGTSLGFMNIMSIATQGSLLGYLRELDGENLVKPLHQQHRFNEPPEITHILNTFFDIEFGIALLFHPQKSEEIFKSPFFESTGHSYRYLYQEVLQLLNYTMKFKNREFSYYEEWENEFRRLEERKENLFFHGSPLLFNEFGAYEIIEGQARFQEIQYLYLMDNDFNWNMLKKAKMLEEPYNTVFEYFINYLNLQLPPNPVSKEVNLFLLVCEIALNPDIGYPNNIVNYQNFIKDINPYCRFIECLDVIKCNKDVINYVEEISFESFVYVSDFITNALNNNSMRSYYREIIKKSNSIENIDELKRKYYKLDYTNENSTNILVEYYYNNHINIVEKKYIYPEFFCWSGQYMTGKFPRFSEEKITEIMEDNSPPFISLDKDEIALYSAHQSKSGYQKFASYFFEFQTFNDLARQLIMKPGAFTFNFLWNQFKDEDKYKEYFREKFYMNTNRNFEDFMILK